jgi:hypothetical protein
MKKACLGVLLLGSLLPLQFSVAHAATVTRELATSVNQNQVDSGFFEDVWTSSTIPIPGNAVVRAGDTLVLDIGFDQPLQLSDTFINDDESYGFRITGAARRASPNLSFVSTFTDADLAVASESGAVDLRRNGIAEFPETDLDLTSSTFSFDEITLAVTLPRGSGEWLPSDVRLSVGADDIAVVPIPAALPLFGTAVAITGFMGWRNRRRAH